MLDNNGDLRQTHHLKRLINKSLPCVSSLFPSQTVLNRDDTIRKRHIYETAFDSAPISVPSRDDELQELSSRLVLNDDDIVVPGPSTDRKDGLVQSRSLDILSQNVVDHASEGKDRVRRVYTPSPPSTAPFSGKFFVKNNTDDTPALFEGRRPRTKDLRLPVKSLRLDGRSENTRNSDPDLPRVEERKRVVETRKDEPTHEVGTRKMFLRYNDGTKEIFVYSKGRRPKYSSSESVATSSSGSVDSLQSSTSDGDHSTSSSDGRRSASLSSHSSDSGNPSGYAPFNFLSRANKLNILSPISDKSSQEGMSDEIDTRNNNSQKVSPEEVVPEPIISRPRRLPLAFHDLAFCKPDLQGSDSGISVQSREGRCRRDFVTANASDPNISDLPFDVPKLHRSRDGRTSGSATSVDLKDLPFDMPKLKRRFRHPPTRSPLMGEQAKLPPELSLNFDEGVGKRPSLKLSFGRRGLDLNVTDAVDRQIDPDLPLERQGWHHGTITRVEAETLLKYLSEGSFLVRNSESQRHDHFLSLKSARGFMHIKIERLESSNLYVLTDNRKPFASVPQLVHHYSVNRLPVHGAEHMCLTRPVVARLL